MVKAYVALLRSVNVGGTGKLPMTALVDLCAKARLNKVRTYIASGNALFESEKSEKEIKAALEGALKKYAGKPVAVLVRTTDEMAAVLKQNPFSAKPGNRTAAIFLDEPPPEDTLQTMKGKNHEEVALGKREIYVYYPDGMGQTKLRIPAAASGTARNMNTVSKLLELLRSPG
jgi:uncharacterized protein (DUF1697 family)